MLPTELRTILVATDFSDCSRRAAEYAVFLAGKLGGRVILFHAFEVPAGLSAATLIPTGEQLQVPLREYLHQAASTQLEETRQALAAGGVPVEVLLDEGRSHLAIVKAAESAHADLLVLGTHGRTGLSHLLLGSTAERVLRHAPCPVFIVREPAPEDPAADVEP